MYLSWIAIIIIALIVYSIGKNAGYEAGREDAESEMRETLMEHGFDYDSLKDSTSLTDGIDDEDAY